MSVVRNGVVAGWGREDRNFVALQLSTIILFYKWGEVRYHFKLHIYPYFL